MAKKKTDYTTRLAGENFLQWQSRLAKQQQDKRDKTQPLITPEAERHGEYAKEGVTRRNLKATPYTLWRSQNVFNENQQIAIEYVINLWDTLPTASSCTANYGEAFGGGGQDESERLIAKRMDAQRAIARMCGGMSTQGEFAPGYIVTSHWSIFENCLRFDEPAGVAGSCLSTSSRSAQAQCLGLIKFVADIIAERENLIQYHKIRAT